MHALTLGRKVAASTRTLYVATPANVSTARRAVAAVLDRADLPNHITSDVQLIVSELAGNAVRHSGSPDFVVEACLLEGDRHGSIGVKVSDRGDLGNHYTSINHWRGEHTALCPRVADPDAESRRGLLLVDLLASHWEVAFCSRVKRKRLCHEGWTRRVCLDHGFAVDHTTVTALVYLERTETGQWRRR